MINKCKKEFKDLSPFFLWDIRPVWCQIVYYGFKLWFCRHLTDNHTSASYWWLLSIISRCIRKLDSVSSVSENVEVLLGASVGAPATDSSSSASARCLASVWYCLMWWKYRHGCIARISDFVCCWMSTITINSGHFIKGVINKPSCQQTFSMDSIASKTVHVFGSTWSDTLYVNSNSKYKWVESPAFGL